MSRSKKGGKGPGYEYWSKRPGTKKTSGPGKFAKKINTRLERLEGKKSIEIERVLDYNEHDDYDDFDGTLGSWSVGSDFDWDD